MDEGRGVTVRRVVYLELPRAQDFRRPLAVFVALPHERDVLRDGRLGALAVEPKEELRVAIAPEHELLEGAEAPHNLGSAREQRR